MMIIEEMAIPANDLGRFVQAQNELYCDYGQALKEVQQGYKYTHWIWYIFPQLRALGHSRRAKYFGIADMDEAVRYMAHPLLSARLMEISGALLEHKGKKTALVIFGEIDSLKVRSCMTLFDAVCPDDVFSEVLDAFYDGQKDNLTLELLSRDKNRNSFTNNQWYNKDNTNMKAKNTNIQSTIAYICSHSGFIALDEKDFELTCPNPTICIDKKGETLNEVLEAVTTEWKMLPLPKPSSTVLFIESRSLTMADIGYIKNSFDGFDFFKFGINCEEPEGAKVRIILIG